MNASHKLNSYDSIVHRPSGSWCSFAAIFHLLLLLSLPSFSAFPSSVFLLVEGAEVLIDNSTGNKDIDEEGTIRLLNLYRPLDTLRVTQPTDSALPLIKRVEVVNCTFDVIHIHQMYYRPELVPPRTTAWQQSSEAPGNHDEKSTNVDVVVAINLLNCTVVSAARVENINFVQPWGVNNAPLTAPSWLVGMPKVRLEVNFTRLTFITPSPQKAAGNTLSIVGLYLSHGSSVSFSGITGYNETIAAHTAAKVFISALSIAFHNRSVLSFADSYLLMKAQSGTVGNPIIMIGGQGFFGGSMLNFERLHFAERASPQTSEHIVLMTVTIANSHLRLVDNFFGGCSSALSIYNSVTFRGFSTVYFNSSSLNVCPNAPQQQQQSTTDEENDVTISTLSTILKSAHKQQCRGTIQFVPYVQALPRFLTSPFLAHLTTVPAFGYRSLFSFDLRNVQCGSKSMTIEPSLLQTLPDLPPFNATLANAQLRELGQIFEEREELTEVNKTIFRPLLAELSHPSVWVRFVNVNISQYSLTGAYLVPMNLERFELRDSRYNMCLKQLGKVCKMSRLDLRGYSALEVHWVKLLASPDQPYWSTLLTFLRQWTAPVVNASSTPRSIVDYFQREASIQDSSAFPISPVLQAPTILLQNVIAADTQLTASAFRLGAQLLVYDYSGDLGWQIKDCTAMERSSWHFRNLSYVNQVERALRISIQNVALFNSSSLVVCSSTFRVSTAFQGGTAGGNVLWITGSRLESNASLIYHGNKIIPFMPYHVNFTTLYPIGGGLHIYTDNRFIDALIEVSDNSINLGVHRMADYAYHFDLDVTRCTVIWRTVRGTLPRDTDPWNVDTGQQEGMIFFRLRDRDLMNPTNTSGVDLCFVGWRGAYNWELRGFSAIVQSSTTISNLRAHVARPLYMEDIQFARGSWLKVQSTLFSSVVLRSLKGESLLLTFEGEMWMPPSSDVSAAIALVENCEMSGAFNFYLNFSQPFTSFSLSPSSNATVFRPGLIIFQNNIFAGGVNLQPAGAIARNISILFRSNIGPLLASIYPRTNDPMYFTRSIKIIAIDNLFQFYNPLAASFSFNVDQHSVVAAEPYVAGSAARRIVEPAIIFWLRNNTFSVPTKRQTASVFFLGDSVNFAMYFHHNNVSIFEGDGGATAFYVPVSSQATLYDSNRLQGPLIRLPSAGPVLMFNNTLKNVSAFASTLTVAGRQPEHARLSACNSQYLVVSADGEALPASPRRDETDVVYTAPTTVERLTPCTSDSLLGFEGRRDAALQTENGKQLDEWMRLYYFEQPDLVTLFEEPIALMNAVEIDPLKNRHKRATRNEENKGKGEGSSSVFRVECYGEGVSGELSSDAPPLVTLDPMRSKTRTTILSSSSDAPSRNNSEQSTQSPPTITSIPPGEPSDTVSSEVGGNSTTTTVAPSFTTPRPPKIVGTITRTITKTEILNDRDGNSTGLEPHHVERAAVAPPPSGGLQEAVQSREMVASVYGSSIVAGLLSPSAASKGTSAARLLGVCSVIEGNKDSGEDWPDPLLFIAVFPLSLGGDGEKNARANGALLSTTLLLLVLFIALLLAASESVISSQTIRKHKALRTVIKAVSILFSLLVAYYSPNVSMVASAVISRSMGRSGSNVLFAVSMLFAHFGVLCYVGVFVVARRFSEERLLGGKRAKLAFGFEQPTPSMTNDDVPSREVPLLPLDAPAPETTERLTIIDQATANNYDNSTNNNKKISFTFRLQVILSPIYESCKILRSTSLWVRMLTIEDVIVAHLLALIAGFQSMNSSTCSVLLILMLVISGLHLLYLVAVRPYAVLLEQCFSVAIAAMQIAVTGLLIASATSSAAQTTTRAASSAGSSSSLTPLISWGFLTLDALIFAQPLALLCLELWNIYRRRRCTVRENRRISKKDDHDLHQDKQHTSSASKKDGNNYDKKKVSSSSSRDNKDRLSSSGFGGGAATLPLLISIPALAAQQEEEEPAATFGNNQRARGSSGSRLQQERSDV